MSGGSKDDKKCDVSLTALSWLVIMNLFSKMKGPLHSTICSLKKSMQTWLIVVTCTSGQMERSFCLLLQCWMNEAGQWQASFFFLAFTLTRYRTPIRCREHTQKQKQTLVCACDLSRPKADECVGFRRLKLRQGVERTVAVGWILVSEGVEKSWGDFRRFDLSRGCLRLGPIGEKRWGI